MGTTAVDRIDRKEARGAGVARIATLAGLLFTVVAALLAMPRGVLAAGGSVALVAAAGFSLAAAWMALNPQPKPVPIPLRVRDRRAPVRPFRD
ncbi:hypothetical protein [Caulobacter sp. 17J65-9]|uniref:hypothetical protein n=1 Tax=Caulobacter sp. 17J65-9 TaxID=2709382 RepID=UPI0013C9D3AC|nr:hypothetical protein [Caulobacter sp. 17J65-9]NEX91406.1 hypothetical protein [Caulobacter sp. 17J65-9]